MSGIASLELRGLVKRFGGLLATDHVSVTIAEGELFALIGPNGAGKSTLIGQIAGELMPDEGEILIGDQSITGWGVVARARSGLGRTFQIAQTIDAFTTLESVVLSRRSGSLSPTGFFAPLLGDKEILDIARETLNVVGLGELTQLRVDRLSHGERKQLELAMALVRQPRVLLLDEPMAGMSPGESETMAQLLSELRGKCTIVLIEHDMDVVFKLADRIGVLASGALIAIGSADDIRNNPLVRASYLGEEEIT
ncbi:MAG: ABC transporter ATP-binding protein [Rhodocyclaceae bacterium]|nr:MAG: ABC transporter ATP-binding protein [Rhodocyclaceae bacterium]